MSCVVARLFRARRAEKGAATLIAVLFLLIVIAFAVLVATSMSSSDITDTSVQQTGVNALFLAESGLERAGGRFVSGTPCANLALDGPYTLGAGSFTINATYTTDFSGAPLPVDECRVQSTGTVGNVQRTVQGVLRLPATSGIVVGNGGVAFQCSGSTCTATPATGTAQNLNGVYCATAVSCIAVGNAGAALLWNGTSWNVAGNTSGATLMGVACEPGNASNCFAAGTNSSGNVILSWNGTVWTAVYSNTAGPTFSGIACAGTGTSTTCYAVGSGGYVVAYNGAPTRIKLAKSSGAESAVSCTSPTACWATESYTLANNFYFEQLNGSSWIEQTYSAGNKNGASLYAISCDSTTDCWAAGARTNGHSSLAYWDGTTWTAKPSTVVQRNLFGIDCLSTSTCWAVGFRGTVLLGSSAGSSRTWVVVPTGTTQRLNAVSFPVGSGGSGVLVQWHEVVS